MCAQNNRIKESILLTSVVLIFFLPQPSRPRMIGTMVNYITVVSATNFFMVAFHFCLLGDVNFSRTTLFRPVLPSSFSVYIGVNVRPIPDSVLSVFVCHVCLCMEHPFPLPHVFSSSRWNSNFVFKCPTMQVMMIKNKIDKAWSFSFQIFGEICRTLNHTTCQKGALCFSYFPPDDPRGHSSFSAERAHSGQHALSQLIFFGHLETRKQTWGFHGK